MSNFFPEFERVTKEEWSDKIHSDLKGKDPELLIENDLIEEIDFSVFYHHSERKHTETPGAFPYTRGMSKPKNDWNNGAKILVDNEAEANTKALSLLMTGADLLWFEATRDNIDWKRVIDGIQFEFIETQFSPYSIDDLNAIKANFPETLSSVQYNLDVLATGELSKLQELSKHFTERQQRFLLINGFELQQAGATTWQEIAFCLNTGHEYLLELMNQNYTIDQATACVSFRIGIGSNYFYEIAKIRALKQLWSKIILEYHPKHACSYNCSITAVIGHMNKSLEDPYTNLLRQTTETMSALAAGVDQIVVLPYDLYSNDAPTELGERMALNIPLILKEESYFDSVIDPVGGSYSLEQLTEKIGIKAWTEFQTIEQQGGLFNESARTAFKQRVDEKRTARIEHFNEGKLPLIGINKYMNPDKQSGSWKKIPDYLGFKRLNFELISKNSSL